MLSLTPENQRYLHQLPQAVTDKIVIILCFSYIVGLLFNLVPETSPKNYFLFGEVELSLKTHAYFAFDHLSKMMLIYVIAVILPYAAILFWLEFIDLLDYLACYNSTWFTIFDYGFEYNDFKLIIVIIWMAWRLGRQ